MAIASSNLTSGFIDLATYDELDKYMYGGDESTAYFVRATQRSTWFTQVPVLLSRASGQAGFGQDFSVTISRAGDYLLYTWLRVTIPELSVALAANEIDKEKTFKKKDGTTVKSKLKDRFIAWTPNLMHNIIREAAVTFNDLVAARFDSWHLDFWNAFTTPAGKQVGYLNMIGMTDDLIVPKKLLPLKVLNLPLPFFYSRDSGVALPTAALPYNEMRLSFSFRNAIELLTTYDVYQFDDGTTVIDSHPSLTTDLVAEAKLDKVQVWANYALVSNKERKQMACAPRDILIEQVQTAPLQNFNPETNPNQNYDIRFSHAIKVLFFGVQNTTVASQWSNYTTDETQAFAIGPVDNFSLLIDQFFPGEDPIVETSLIYENTQRLAQMGSDYYSLVQPYYTAPTIPPYVGYHTYSYSLDFICLDPLGSTNYGKLTNVSIIPTASATARLRAAPGVDVLIDDKIAQATQKETTFVNRRQTYRFIVTAVNNNIIRISGGALGFPVL